MIAPYICVYSNRVSHIRCHGVAPYGLPVATRWFRMGTVEFRAILNQKKTLITRSSPASIWCV